MALDRKLNIMCGWCGKKSRLGVWNDLTYNKCTNREMKRAFTSLTERRAFLKKSDTFYMCPVCGKWSRGSQLRITDTTDKSLLKLGGESVISVVNNNKLKNNQNFDSINQNNVLREQSIEEKVANIENERKEGLGKTFRVATTEVIDLDELV